MDETERLIELMERIDAMTVPRRGSAPALAGTSSITSFSRTVKKLTIRPTTSAINN